MVDDDFSETNHVSTVKVEVVTQVKIQVANFKITQLGFFEVKIQVANFKITHFGFLQ